VFVVRLASPKSAFSGLHKHQGRYLSLRTERRREMSYKVNVVIEKDEYGYYAYCPELEGCQTQGDTLEEVLANVKEAIELYLETLSEDEIRTFLSKEILTTSLEVKVD
jgi:predicted RNase H-like HicB family nuclease